ncbi:hypothetical protein HYE82_30755 [Streptomyces sp. BR123]|uniref:DUF6415 family natural product biosynthesis protein n=1 Tax=Streptomyces sp. BR123 TaxID=2749828 RepID=UPI0015C492B4|nr:DUF6415 family natural product biosynthesis protein [Streptomyces sp. BR123]NXY98683.1 hypothetical protein [Streptomyces sp. BR123]
MTGIDQAELDAGARLIVRALVPFEQKPADGEIAGIAVDLQVYGDLWFPEVAALGSADAVRVLDDWNAVLREGPADSPFGRWTHTRALARVLRRLHALLSRVAAA